MFKNYRPDQLENAKTELDNILKTNKQTIEELLRIPQKHT